MSKYKYLPFFIGMAITLWLGTAAIFGLTKRPEFLQAYYAHFSLIGIVLIGTMLVSWLLHSVRFSRSLFLVSQSFIVLILIGWVALSGQIVQTGIHHLESPSLKEAGYSRVAYDQLKQYLSQQQYQKVIFLRLSETMWWSIGKGVMISVLFPRTESSFDGYNGYTAPDGLISDSETLVLSQSGDMQFEIVR